MIIIKRQTVEIERQTKDTPLFNNMLFYSILRNTFAQS